MSEKKQIKTKKQKKQEPNHQFHNDNHECHQSNALCIVVVIEINMVPSDNHPNGWCFLMENTTQNIEDHLDVKTLYMFYQMPWMRDLLASGHNPYVNHLSPTRMKQVEQWFHHQKLLSDISQANPIPHHEANVIMNDADNEFKQTNDNNPTSFSTSCNFLSDIDIYDYHNRYYPLILESNIFVVQSNLQKMEKKLSKSFKKTEDKLNQIISNQQQLEHLCLLAGQSWEVFVKFWYCLKDNQNADFTLTNDTLNKILSIAAIYFCRLEHYGIFRHNAENQKINHGKQQNKPIQIINNHNHEKQKNKPIQIINNNQNYGKQQNKKTFSQFMKLKCNKLQLLQNQFDECSLGLLESVNCLNLREQLYGCSRSVLSDYFSRKWYEKDFDVNEQCAILFSYGFCIRINALRECLYELKATLWIENPGINLQHNDIPLDWFTCFENLCRSQRMSETEIYDFMFGDHKESINGEWKPTKRYFTKKGERLKNNQMDCKKLLWLMGNLIVHYDMLSGIKTNNVFPAIFDILKYFPWLPNLIHLVQNHLVRILKKKCSSYHVFTEKQLMAKQLLSNLKKDLNIVYLLMKVLYRDPMAYEFLWDGILTLSLRSIPIKEQRDKFEKANPRSYQ